MIPIIGVMIAAYIFLRCLEILATVDRVESAGNRLILKIVAACVLLLSLFGGIALTQAGGDAARMMQMTSPSLGRLPRWP